MLNLRNVTLAAGLAIASIGAFAQTPPTDTPRIDQREIDQGNRIGDGVNKGELTPHQTRHLAKQQRKIDKAEAKAKADGVVTPQEQAKITAMQDHASRTIAKDKKIGAADNR